MMSNLIQCNECNHIFKYNETEIKTEIVKGDISRHYFECPGCHFKYTTFYENKPIREKIDEIQRLLKKPTLKQKQADKLKRLRRQVKIMTETLKGIVEDEI